MESFLEISFLKYQSVVVVATTIDDEEGKDQINHNASSFATFFFQEDHTLTE